MLKAARLTPYMTVMYSKLCIVVQMSVLFFLVSKFSLHSLGRVSEWGLSMRFLHSNSFLWTQLKCFILLRVGVGRKACETLYWKESHRKHTHCNRVFLLFSSLFFSELFELISWVHPINSWYKYNSNQLNVKGSNWKKKKLNGWISFLKDPKKGKQWTNSQCSLS
jgi:hypothetical protein